MSVPNKKKKKMPSAVIRGACVAVQDQLYSVAVSLTDGDAIYSYFSPGKRPTVCWGMCQPLCVLCAGHFSSHKFGRRFS